MIEAKDGTNGRDESKKRPLDEHVDDDNAEEVSKRSKTPSTTNVSKEEKTTEAGGACPRIQQEGQGETAQNQVQEEGGEASSAAKEVTLPQKDAESSTCATPASPSQEVAGEEDSKSKRDERRMEINRQRAKEIRKRKKKMVEDMQKQIIYLTLENNKLRTQTQMQQAEINLLRNNGAAKAGGMLGNVGAHQLEFLAAQQQQQQNFNQNTLLNPSSTGGASASLLAGLVHLPQASLSSLGANLGPSPISSQPQGNHDPFSSLQNSALSRLAANPATNPLIGGVNLPGSANLQSLLANSGNGNMNAYHSQQFANALASQQEQQQDTNDHILGMGGTMIRPQSGTGTSSADSVAAAAAAGSLQHQDVVETSHHQQISNLLANTSSEMKSNLLERLQSEESEARILSMILEQQKKQNDGSM